MSRNLPPDFLRERKRSLVQSGKIFYSRMIRRELTGSGVIHFKAVIRFPSH